MLKKDSEITLLLLLLASLFGVYLRIAPILHGHFPILDGGLFYTMVQDLEKAHFHLPQVTTYNHLSIPYAYPPLTLYFVGFIHQLTHVSLIEIIRWMPPLFSVFTIPAFYLLARGMLGRPIIAATATLVFSLMPRSYEWFIMGGGVARTPALLFFILFSWSCILVFKRLDWKIVPVAAIFGALVVLSHPERILQAIMTGLLFWIWMGRTIKASLKAIMIGVGVILISAPWWATVLLNHGIQPFLLAAQSGSSRLLFWAPILQLNFTDETIPLLALFTILGLFICWKQGKGMIAAWFFVLFLVDPRSAPNISSIPAALLSALTIPFILSIGQSRMDKGESIRLEGGFEKLIFGYLLMLMLFNGQSNVIAIEKLTLRPQDRDAMTWVTTATSLDSRFLILDWQETPMLSPLLEWFPALTNGVSITTNQGREWLPGKAHYTSRMNSFSLLLLCDYKDANCLNEWAQHNEDSFDYVYLSLTTAEGVQKVGHLYDSLITSPEYMVVYNSSDVIIFERTP